MHKLTRNVSEVGIALSILTLGFSLWSNKASLTFLSTSTLAGTIALSRKASKDEEKLRLATELKDTHDRLNRAHAYTSEVENRYKSIVKTLEDTRLQLNQVTARAQKSSESYEIALRDLEHLGTELKTVSEVRDLFKSQLEALQKTFEEQKAQWAEDFEHILAENAQKTEELQETQRSLQRYQDVNDTILELERTKLQMKSQALEDELEELRAHKAYLETAVAKGQMTLTELQEEFKYLSDEGYEALERYHAEGLNARDRELMRLSGLVETLSQPLRFEQLGDFQRADQLLDILNSLESPVALDASEIVPGDHSGCFTAFYNVKDRKARGKALIDHLNSLGESLMSQVMTIKPLVFKQDPLNPHRIEVSFVYRKAPVTEKSVQGIWKSKEQFASIAGKWSRVRITGGSESGKSPLAELVACSMQKVKGDVDIKLAFPLSGSRKDFWGIPNSYQDYQGVLEAARDLRKLCEARDAKEDTTTHFVACILDECDTTLNKFRDLATEVKQVIKVGSHNNVGIILLGQNANVRQWAGFDRSDFENLVNVYIGSNALHGIENSNMSEDEKKGLKAKYDRLKEYCDAVNDDISDESLKTRFALVVEPQSTPFFIELPKFGSMTFDNRKVQEVQQETVSISCPHCGSKNYSKNGRDRQGNQKYKCKADGCGKTFKV